VSIALQLYPAHTVINYYELSSFIFFIFFCFFGYTAFNHLPGFVIFSLIDQPFFTQMCFSFLLKTIQNKTWMNNTLYYREGSYKKIYHNLYYIMIQLKKKKLIIFKINKIFLNDFKITKSIQTTKWSFPLILWVMTYYIYKKNISPKT